MSAPLFRARLPGELRGRWMLPGLLTPVLAIIDQASKHAAGALGDRTLLPGVLLLAVRRNRGGLLGVIADLPDGPRRALLVAASVVAATFLLWFYRYLAARPESPLPARLAVSLMLAGTLGNLLDRVLYGAVVDCLHLRAGEVPIVSFNVADLLITSGLCVFFVDLLRSASGRRKRKPTRTATEPS